MSSAKFIVANWKATKTLSETLAWWQTFANAKFTPKNIHIVICPPFVHLFTLADKIKSAEFPFPVTLGAQDVSAYPEGTYTGEIPAKIIATAVSHAVLGHSERRLWLKETPQIIAQKTRQALDNNIVPIISVDKNSYRQQLTQFDDNELSKIIVMYEPPEAISRLEGPIGTGKPADADDVKSMVKNIKLIVPDSPIVYGGSVKSRNIRDYLCLSGIDGVVPGTASMNVNEFINLINQT